MASNLRRHQRWRTCSQAKAPRPCGDLSQSTLPSRLRRSIAGLVQGSVRRPEKGFQHPDLDKAWAEYDASVEAVAELVEGFLRSQFEAATEAGDLDSALRWRAANEQFKSDGTVPEGVDNPKTGPASAPREGAVPVASRIKQANERLEKAYESVEKALVKTVELEKAKTARRERIALLAEPRRVPEARAGRDALEGKWVYEGWDGFVANVEIRKNGSVIWRVGDSVDSKWLTRLDDTTFLISDERGKKGRDGWVVVRLTGGDKKVCICDDWNSGEFYAVLKKIRD